MGKYHGKASFDTFVHRKSVLLQSNHFDSSIRYPPYTASKVKGYNRLNFRVSLRSITKALIPFGAAVIGGIAYMYMKN
jgi:hypothetical protein